MSWNANAPKNDEASKIRWELVPYMHGVALDLGCGGYKVFPHFIGIDSGKEWGKLHADVIVDTAERMPLFASNSADCVFSSHLLEHIEDYKSALKEWWRIVKQGGYLALYLPDEDEYPKVGKTGANVDHKWNVNFDKVVEAMPDGWDLVDFQKRNQDDEYSLFFVFRKGGRENKQSWRDPKPTRTCGIVRLGAIGDMIQTSSLFPWLKEQGFNITLYCQAGQGYQTIKNDPHVDRFIVQGHDEVPPQFLKEFLEYTSKKYDKWVNLCESVEGTLLPSPGHIAHQWPNALRAKYCDRNYLEWTHELAEVPPPYQPKFYSTLEEKAWARKKASQWGGRNILWSLAGSSGHKVWPHLDQIIARVMLELPDVHVVLVGDDLCKLLEIGWAKESRVHCQSGEWSIRESMAFAEVADLIIGSETGLLNAAGSLPNPKIVTLSHSSEEMLTKHWKNVIALRQPQGLGCDKQPCRQLHFGWDYCPKHEETGTALCQYHIDAEMMWDAILSVFNIQSVKAA